MNTKLRSSLLVKYLEQYQANPASKVFAPLAETYRKLGMIEEAFKIVTEGLHRHPDYLLGHIVLAHCYVDKKLFKEAYTVLKPFVETHIDNISLQKLYAEAALRTGNLYESLQTLKYLLFLNPRDKEIVRKVKALEDDLQVEALSQNQGRVTETAAPSISEPEEWVQVSFHGKKEENVEEISAPKVAPIQQKQTPQDDWTMQKMVPEEIQNEPEVEPDHFASVDPESESTQVSESPAPFITHTLVDLYCSQKHFDKAIEILEKILELNPRDQKTQQKLEEVRRKIHNPTQSGHDKLLDLIEKQVKGRDPFYQTLNEKFDGFLKALRKRASTV
ncbi:MAG: hypothetical protein JNM93_10370 [Bacteriovoracaceae bacterium]|nr:hypothetical protein [Bacteriovoracaceae bacterium]